MEKRTFPLGVMLESFRLPLADAMKKTAELGAQGFQAYATNGELAPENLTGDKRRAFRRMAESYGLQISALCGDLGLGFGDRERNPALIERSKRILDLALELGTDVVTTHVGVIPADPAHEPYGIMQEACGELARYADGLGAHFAIETGPEPAGILRTFLDGLHSTGVAVNLDPANLVMMVGDDPVQAVYTLKDYIVHTHAKDGRQLRPAGAGEGAAFEELPLGEGDVEFPRYLQALADIGFQGFLTVEREVGDAPERDIQAALAFLRRGMGA